MRLLAVTGAAVLAWLPLAGAAAAPTPDEVARLLRGETIVKEITLEGMRGIEARFFAKAPREVAFRILADTEQLPAFMPAMTECRVLERGDGYAVVKQVGEGGELTQRRVAAPPDEIRWSLIRSPMLRNLKGYWHLEPLDGGTLLAYGLAVEPVVPVPSGVVRHFQQQKLPPLVENVRARIESRGTWTKPEHRR